ncbi:ankyrin repeat domain-containing protein [Legionella cincinnatiensis]|uniref:Ankyrin repeat protein n=1 Tax=Legionella cincinnatiensis TaxID=28085 RepID=A0A378IKQ6_9GAMM|nr:ankyrin repeat domain-containing protein [Legionella cincinnatiensis]KTC83130.1 Ankyrin repeat protein [Legionella cincinnatiensis]STX35739.1 Ankyrin repeat protein [Legionella cincinnatiensis]
MVTKFEALCRSLDIKSPPAAQDLDKLINWCEHTVSTDLHFEGTLQERFEAYQDLATGFLEHIKPNTQTDNLTFPVPALKGMTSLQFIVDFGLDIYLKTLNPSAKQINTKVNGITLLQLAAARGHYHTTEILLSLGANPQEKNTKGEPLLFSILMLPIQHNERMKKNKQLIFTLLNRSSENILKERNQSNDTILHIMAIYGYDKLVEQVLTQPQTKELAFVSNNLGHYPIHAAILNAQHQCAKLLLYIDGVEQLTDAKGRNALHYAARYSDVDMMKICLRTCPKDSVDKHRQTPLILASIANNMNAVQELLHHGAEINKTDMEHRSALHYAVEANHLNIVKLLLECANIDVNLSDDYYQTPLDLVKQNTSKGAMIHQLLINHGAHPHRAEHNKP